NFAIVANSLTLLGRKCACAPGGSIPVAPGSRTITSWLSVGSSTASPPHALIADPTVQSAGVVVGSRPAEPVRREVFARRLRALVHLELIGEPVGQGAVSEVATPARFEHLDPVVDLIAQLGANDGGLLVVF